MAKKPVSTAAMPWHPVKLSKSEARAIQALYEGNASEPQQRKALELFITRFGAADDLEFRPDEFGGERASCFASGRRFVGQQMRRWALATGAEIESLPD
jgi:hypothetical protein